MKQLKKTLLTLVALLAVTTGAWAGEEPQLLTTINASINFLSGSKTFDDKVTITFSDYVYYSDEEGWYSDESLLTVAGTNGYTITSCKFYTNGGDAETGYPVEGENPSVYLSAGTVFTDNSQSVEIGYQGITKIEVYGTAPASASSGPEVAWDKAKKTGTFTMPGGNVTLEPEYYPQATVADGGVTAADADARATTDDPLVKVDATKLTGAKKLMYFVSNSGTAPAYDAEGWNDQLPTAEGFTQQGIVYVWYYPVGTDEGVDGATATYSDGDICLQSITARIAAEPAPDLSHTLADGSYYVKNGALSLYMAAGGSYGTHGIVNERGLDLIFTYNSGTKTYTIDSRLDDRYNHFLGTGLYMDASSFGWTVEGENSFTISANLDGVKNYLAVDQNNNLVYTQDGTAENAQWIIIPKADHENAVLAAGLNAMKAATAENGVDATFLIACPGFNRNDKRNAEAWTVEGNNLKMGGAGSEGNGCAECYHSTFTLSQTLSNAPAGVYTLTAQGFYQQNGSDNENLPYFYANDEKQTFKLLEEQIYNMSDAGPLFTQGKYTIDPITVVVAEDGALTIGAKLETNTQLWSCWDNFKLTYYGPVMYAVTFADDTAEPTLWTAEPNTDVKKGETVTVTYTGSKKVIGVKAEKNAATPAVQARTWNFTQWSEATVNNIKADAATSKTEGWSDIEKEKDAKDGKSAGETEDKCFWYQGEVKSDGTLSANGSVIEELKGLKFNEEYASSRDLAIAVDYSSTSLGDYAGGAYLMLGGGKVQSPDKRICCFTIPNVKIGQKITVVVESHKPSTRRGISLFVNSVKDDGNKIGDSFMPTTKESYTWENWTLPDGITADGDTVDILVCNNDVCHIYSITVE